MTRTRRTFAVSAAFVIAMGASGVAASAAFADATPAPTVTTSSAPEAADPTFVLTSVGGGLYTLALTVPGTSVAISYAVDTAGAVTGATTSTPGATVAAHDNELRVTLADGREVKVELGDRGDAVHEVSVSKAHPGDSKDEGDSTGEHADSAGAVDTPEPAGSPDAADAAKSPEARKAGVSGSHGKSAQAHSDKAHDSKAHDGKAPEGEPAPSPHSGDEGSSGSHGGGHGGDSGHGSGD